MSTTIMQAKDYIVIQKVEIQNKKCIVKWLPNAIHREFLLCFKSSHMDFNMFKQNVTEHFNQDEYEDALLYFKRIKGGNQIEIPREKLRFPVEIFMLPIREDMLYLPAKEENLNEVQYICKGIVNLKSDLKKISFLGNDCKLTLMFLCPEIPLREDEIIAEYIIDEKVYPVTVKMLGKNIEVFMKKSSKYYTRIHRKYEEKYTII